MAISQPYRSIASKLPGDLGLRARSLIAFSENVNRRRPPVETQRITMIVFAAWLRDLDGAATGLPLKEVAEALDSAARCAQSLTPHQVKALQDTLVAYSEKLASDTSSTSARAA